MQILVFVLIFVGEALVIYAEEMGAKLHGILGYSMGATVAWALVPGVIGVALLAGGYALGIKTYHNVWAASAISLSTYLLVEPLFNYLYIGQLPELGSGVGFALGILGILAVTFL